MEPLSFAAVLGIGVFCLRRLAEPAGNSLSAGTERLTDSRPSGRFIAAHRYLGGLAVSGELDRTSADGLRRRAADGRAAPYRRSRRPLPSESDLGGDGSPGPRLSGNPL